MFNLDNPKVNKNSQSFLGGQEYPLIWGETAQVAKECARLGRKTARLTRKCARIRGENARVIKKIALIRGKMARVGQIKYSKTDSYMILGNV